MKSRSILILTILLLVSVLSACAHKRPVLYPNAHYKAVGERVARADVAFCMDLAAHSGTVSDEGEEMAREAATEAAVGAAQGAAVGAVVGGDAGTGAAAGAAARSTGAVTRRMFRSDRPDPVTRRFVERCLAKKGYDTIGWR